MTSLTIPYHHIGISFMLLLVWDLSIIPHVSGQSNYASHANNIGYQGGLPEEATLDGKVTKLDDISPIIFLNRTKAALNCAAGSMEIEMKFNEPFFGLAYADFDRNSACQVLGKGELSYKLELPLKGCGTKQDPQRVFTNNVVVRFHPGLEMDGDEIITIVCRYPPPIAPVPIGVYDHIKTIIPAGVITPPLKGIQILLIICAIMFLTLVLLGIGVSYYCLRRRTIPVVRRLPLSIGSGSEITKLSGSSLGNISHFEGLKIPRAHAPLVPVHSSSGSEGQLISDTLPSDYPSESVSETEDVDTRSLPVSSAGSFENRAYVHDNSSIYSEHYGHTQEFHTANAAMVVKETSPKFDVQVRVKRAPPPPPSPLSSDSESTTTSIRDRNNLSTIMESHEDRESVVTIESMPHDTAQSHFTYVPELHPAPKHVQPPPVFTRILRRQQEQRQKQSWPEDLADGPPEFHTTAVEIEQVERLPEPPIVVKRPEITSHVVDDVFLRTITEKKTIEDIEKYKRMVTEYKARPVVDQTWDVTIRNYPTEGNNQPQWEDFSDISSASGMTLTPKMERSEFSIPPPTYINESGLKLTSPELVGNMKPIEIPPEDKSVANWDVLIRVLEQEEDTIADDVSSEHSSHFLQRQLSYDDRAKWKEIITTESTLRSMLTEAVVREDFERIRSDTRYERIFEPQTWDVLIRILAPPEEEIELRAPNKRIKKKEPWDTRSRRSSLPTLYEYDSDGGSSVRTITYDAADRPSQSLHPQSRRTSRSSYRSDNVDMRSMSEVMVNFSRPDQLDNVSDASSLYPNRYYEEDNYDKRSIQRSLSQPSLARSASEFTERWIAPDNTSEISSPEGTPVATRTNRVLTTFQPRPQPPAIPRRVVTAETQYVQQSTTSFHGTTSPPKEWYSSTQK
ncbi:hypothetical protein Bhyg_14308 [Pseudolycoriella hygida]|uniref:ZP domain-containing protein n=1 Tax=Pseudolycoriella hygida TaxID=35572 RepID=A0A9Q0MSV4_9DIPT|nr:hypothetical protein Bhyg_14308 [Pseudolycoriella hygida]